MKTTKAESARDHLANAMQGLMQPLADLTERDLSDIRARLTKALALVDAEARLLAAGVDIEIDFERRSYTVVRRFKRVIAQSTNYKEIIEVARQLRADLKGHPDITISTHRPAIAVAGE